VPDDEPTDRLLSLLDLTPAGSNRWLATTPEPGDGPPRLFGGQVAAQSLRAATLTVGPERLVHSFHAYFIRPGRPGVPLQLDVERARDGRSFTTRRVNASQDGESIFVLDASFQVDEDGDDWQPDDSMPDVPPPDEVEQPESPFGSFSTMSPFEMRPIGGRNTMGFALHPYWMRTKGRLPDDDAIHACAIAFMSDMGILSAARPPGSTAGFGGASLDHAVWFHVPVRADEWLLFDASPLRAAGARGMAHGTMHTTGGVLAVTIVQEGLLRPSMKMPPEFEARMRALRDEDSSTTETGA
jgi:acyl-CoA thioesterase-2